MYGQSALLHLNNNIINVINTNLFTGRYTAAVEGERGAGGFRFGLPGFERVQRGGCGVFGKGGEDARGGERLGDFGPGG